MNHHEASTRSASLSSFKAKKESTDISACLERGRQMNEGFTREIRKFNNSMTNVVRREEARIDLEEKVWQNAGKQLDYFKLPSVAKRVNYKSLKTNEEIRLPKLAPIGIKVGPL